MLLLKTDLCGFYVLSQDFFIDSLLFPVFLSAFGLCDPVYSIRVLSGTLPSKGQ
jgi:hypothetical protein